jgi:amino acid transporter
VRDAERTVPRATVASLVMAGALYALVHLACVWALPELADTKSPIPAAATVLGGAKLSRAVAAGVVASIGGIAIGMHAMTPRYLSALALFREDDAVPTRSILITAAGAAIFCMFSSLEGLLSLSSIAVLAQYGTASLALLVLARRRREGLAPADAWPVPFALVVVAVLLLQAPVKWLAIAAAVALVGIALARRLAKAG